MAQLFIKNADGEPSVYEIDGRCTVGRHPDNMVVLEHVSVSGHHAELLLHEGHYLLKDLISSNGTYVNKHQIMIHQLKHNDQIRFGKVDATISIEEASDARAPMVPPPLLNVPPGQG